MNEKVQIKNNNLNNSNDNKETAAKFFSQISFGTKDASVDDQHVVHPEVMDLAALRINYIGRTIQYRYGNGELSSQTVYHPQSRSRFLSSLQKIGILCCDKNCNIIAAMNIYINDEIYETITTNPTMVVLSDLISSRRVSENKQINAIGVMSRGMCVVDPSTHNPTVCSVVAVLE